MVYNSPMRFEVPQFIEIEDKIIGPLTWRQFIYIAGGVGILVLLYIFTPLMIFVFIGIPFGVLAFTLAFHRVNNRPFSIFLESFFSYMTKKRLYLWRKDKTQTITTMSERREGVPTIPDANTGSITSLSHKLEHHIPE